MKNPFSILLPIIALVAGSLAQQSSKDEAAIRAIEERWDTANLKGDAAALDAIFADGFISTDSEGQVRPKTEVVAELRSGNIKYRSAKTEDVKIIAYENAAVVSGIWKGSYDYRGKKVDLVERFTNFYVRQSGQWRCVASHGSAIK